MASPASRSLGSDSPFRISDASEAADTACASGVGLGHGPEVDAAAPHGGAAEEPPAAKKTKRDLELTQSLAAGQAAKKVNPAEAREASGKLVETARGGVLKQVILILALGADVDTRDRVRAAGV